ncbi:uncharacterized protein DSM5745_08864 [Aspergillus mulundensis]|uniref:Uncharacterized protein n=1 Tax=Aspergillus mulundensis TaxID=1810919 RepID=A0A3D8R5M1_9EURO|nr:hypothetical protein DSM5745_08864 [Aspergillus mulundensis]RDW69104.1 hypothetical protein DSM5745_08864 [Aspergillus mulundensis]
MGILPLLKLPLLTLSLTLLAFFLLTYHQYPRIQSTLCQSQTTPNTRKSPLDPEANLKTFFPAAPSPNDNLLSDARLTANGGFFMAQAQAQDSTKPNAKAHGYGVSMLHQSHCIDMLRAALFTPQTQNGHEHHAAHLQPRRDGLRELDVLDAEHLGHCLDYIAQGIVCCADDTLEPRVLDPERKVAVINGMGVRHRCRDARGVLEAVGRSQREPVRLAREIVGGETVRGVLGLEG